MKCFKCGAEAPAGNKFCPHCGASMSVEQNQEIRYSSQGNQNPQVQSPVYQKPMHQNLESQKIVYHNQGDQAHGHEGDSLATPSMVLGIVADIALILVFIIALTGDQKFLGFSTGIYSTSTTVVSGLLVAVGGICAIIGFILAIISLIKKTTKKGRAITGFVCSGIIVIPCLIGVLMSF